MGRSILCGWNTLIPYVAVFKGHPCRWPRFNPAVGRAHCCRLQHPFSKGLQRVYSAICFPPLGSLVGFVGHDMYSLLQLAGCSTEGHYWVACRRHIGLWHCMWQCLRAILAGDPGLTLQWGEPTVAGCNTPFPWGCSVCTVQPIFLHWDPWWAAWAMICSFLQLAGCSTEGHS